jgi:glycosyltransferase involved in cell wall biosynthesis
VLRAALSIEQDVGSIANELEKLFAMDALSLRAMGERGRKLVEEHYAWEEIGKSMVAVYKWLLGEKAAPDCVLLD